MKKALFNSKLLVAFLVLMLCKSTQLFAQLPTYQDIIINEVLADNKTSGLDAYGQSDDWIELYNPTSDTIALEGYFITDNANDRFKFRIPGGKLGPESYTIIWADNETWQVGGIHANFSLSAAGDAVFLFGPTGDFIDSVVFGFQHQDVSWGRCANGDNQFAYMSPSPLYLNKTSCAVGMMESSTVQTKVYFNAAAQQIVIESTVNQPIDLIDITGKKLAQFTSDDSPYSTENLAPGIYIIALKDRQIKLAVYGSNPH